MRIPLPYQAYKVGVTASTMRLVNCFAEKLPGDARLPYCLKRAPGVESIIDAIDASGATGGPIRGMHSAFGRLWVVAGTEFLMIQKTVLQTYTATLIGSIGATSFGAIDIENNAEDVVVVNAPLAYKCSSTGTSFAQITDTDFTSRGASEVEFLGQYLLFREPNSGRFFCSDIGSSTAYTSTNFATAESSPDLLMAIKVDHEQVILFGERTTEIWQLQGGAGFPFGRAANGTIELGCPNTRTIAKQDETVVWVANDRTVRALRGSTPEKISHAGVEEALKAVNLDQATAWSYTEVGHLFYVLTFPDRCFVYDFTEKLWHERESFGLDTSAYRWKCSANAFGLQLVGDAFDQDGRIASLTTDSRDEFDEPVVMSWTYQPVYAETNRAFHDRLEIVCKTGVGNIDDTIEPQIMLEVSDDGGQSFEHLPTRSLGAIGRRDTRPYWTQLGQSDNRVYRASVSDDIDFVAMDTQLQARFARL